MRGEYGTGADAGSGTSYQAAGLANGVSYTVKVTTYDRSTNESGGVETEPLMPLPPESWDLKFTGYGDDAATCVAVGPNNQFVYVAGYGQDLLGATGKDWWRNRASQLHPGSFTGVLQPFARKGNKTLCPHQCPVWEKAIER